MRTALLILVLLGLPAVAALAADDKPKSVKIVATDAAKAGADFPFQGEYVAEHDGRKIGIQVIAEGNGQFMVKGFRGGLPGDGFDGEGTKQGKGKLEDGKVTFTVEKATGTITMDGKLVAKSENGDEVSATKVTRKSPTEGAKPPEGAIVLFDGKNLDGWTKMDRKTAPSWLLRDDGVTQVKGGDIVSKQKLGSFTLHVEFMLPYMPNDRGQGRANSGVYLQNRYELQVLDSFGLKGLNNEAGGFYQAHDPKVNMCYPPLQWQTYDIEFTAPKFEDGKKVANARATVKHNGVVVQDDVELKNSSPGGDKETTEADGIRLQDHGNPMMFRNIWAVEKK